MTKLGSFGDKTAEALKQLKDTTCDMAGRAVDKVTDMKDATCEMAINQLTSTSYKAVELVGQIDVHLSEQHSVYEVADFSINGHLGVTGGLSISINFKKKVSSGPSPQEEVRCIPVT